MDQLYFHYWVDIGSTLSTLLFLIYITTSTKHHPYTLYTMENQHNKERQAERVTLPRREYKTRKRDKNYGIIMFTTSICLSCCYLETQIFYPILEDRKAYYMSILTYIDVWMCLWSYFQTIRIGNKVHALKGTPFIHNKDDLFFDYNYGVTQKKCDACSFYKLARVSHCSNCGECTYKMDHHCIWTQTCIGLSNQKSFYLFCLYMTIGVFQFWYFTVRVLNEKTKNILELMQPGVAIIWAITAFSAGFVGLMIIMLFVTHTLMILTNFRTLDGMKTGRMCPMPFFTYDNDPDFMNIYDRGEIQNIKEIFGENWVLWFIPLQRKIMNEFFVEKMNPHPDKLSLMKYTDLFQVQQKYCKYMRELSGKIGSLFVGKKMRVNNEVFMIQSQR